MMNKHSKGATRLYARRYIHEKAGDDIAARFNPEHASRLLEDLCATTAQEEDGGAARAPQERLGRGLRVADILAVALHYVSPKGSDASGHRCALLMPFFSAEAATEAALEGKRAALLRPAVLRWAAAALCPGGAPDAGAFEASDEAAAGAAMVLCAAAVAARWDKGMSRTGRLFVACAAGLLDGVPGLEPAATPEPAAAAKRAAAPEAGGGDPVFRIRGRELKRIRAGMLATMSSAPAMTRALQSLLHLAKAMQTSSADAGRGPAEGLADAMRARAELSTWVRAAAARLLEDGRREADEAATPGTGDAPSPSVSLGLGADGGGGPAGSPSFGPDEAAGTARTPVLGFEDEDEDMPALPV